MRIRPRPIASATRLELGRPRRDSYTRLAISDGTVLFGIASVLCGTLGIADDLGDAVVLLGAGTAALAIGITTHRSLDRRRRPTPGKILTGLTLTWLVLVVLGAGVYLATGTVDDLADALVEAAAGFSTTAMTTLDPGELSLPVQLWRASTQWIGGILGVIVAVIALPLAFRESALGPDGRTDSASRLAPTPLLGRRRIVAIYGALTVVLGAAYLIVGMGAKDSFVHAMTTISTGGFSSRPDSFAGFDAGARSVATVGMALGGCSFFVLWWIAKGRTAPLWRNTELRVYLGLLAAGPVMVTLTVDGIGVGDAIFTATAAMSTTGFAVGEWTTFAPSALVILLLLIGTGAMSNSAGGGLRVARAWMLIGFAARELRRQLDRHAVVVIKQGGQAIDERTLERTTGYQIAHLGLCGLAAFLLAAAGIGMIEAIYTGISVLSTHGPGPATGAYGSLEGFSTPARLFLLPFMLAGRLTILPLMLGVSFLFTVERQAVRQGRRIARRVVSR